MTTRDEVLDVIGATSVIAILRGDFLERAEEVGQALLEGGVRVAEVSLASTHAVATIERLAITLGARLTVGAGTVMTVGDCARAADAGARFLLSPHFKPALVEGTRSRGLVSIPGALTPSEIVAALDAGADAVKLYPAELVPPAVVAALLAPLPGTRLVPTGGVTASLTREYVARGAWAVGAGSHLVGPDALTPGGLERLTQRAAQFTHAAVEAKAAPPRA